MRKNKNGELCFSPCAIPCRSKFVAFCMASRSEKFVFSEGKRGKENRESSTGGGRRYDGHTNTHTCCVVCMLSISVSFVVVHYLLVFVWSRGVGIGGNVVVPYSHGSGREWFRLVIPLYSLSLFLSVCLFFFRR